MNLAAPFDARTRLGLILPTAFVAVLGLIVTVGAANRAGTDRVAALEQVGQAEAENAARLISLRLEQDGHAIERMGERMAARPGGTPESEWRADAAAYLRDKSWLRAVYWIDEDGVRWNEPEDAPEISTVVSGQGGAGEAGEGTLGRLHAGATARLGDGEFGMVAYYPIEMGEGGIGVLVSIFDVGELLRSIRPDETPADYEFALTAGRGGPVLAGNGDIAAGQRSLTAVAPIDAYEVGWLLHAAPTPLLLDRFQPFAGVSAWLSGFALTALGALLAFMAQLARRQADRLEETDAVRRVSEQRYNLVVRGMAIGVWDWNVPEGRLDWSPNALRILGLPADFRFASDTGFFDRVHPEDVEGLQTAIREHVEHNEPYMPDFRIRHADGHYVWCHATGQAILDEAGNPLRMAGSIQDITEERAAEEAREKTERRLMAVTQSAVDAVLTTTSKGIIEQVNPACTRIFGYQPEELLGANIRILTPAEHRRKHDYYIRHYIETGDSEIVGKVREVEGIHKDGHTIPIELAVTEYKAGEDRIFIATVRDLTARKAAEAERERFIARLEETNAELERFNFAASHDLREPLRMIGNFSQMLLRNHRDKLEGDARKALEICAGSAERMQALLDDLISFSRASEDLGQVEDFVPVDMIDLARQNLSEAIDASGASFETVHLPQRMRANPTRFSRVFQNLIANSIKYAKDGEAPHVQISAAPYEQGWLFTLSDRGIGIKPEYCEQIFEPFQRLHPASKYSGTGMGLAICRKIVNTAGGRIWAESALGEGSRFYVYWPEGPPAAAAGDEGRDMQQKSAADASQGEQA